jgi:hypothetical protein
MMTDMERKSTAKVYIKKELGFGPVTSYGVKNTEPSLGINRQGVGNTT